MGGFSSQSGNYILGQGSSVLIRWVGIAGQWKFIADF